ncbi:MAG: stage III sporulation protein AD [Clostridiaceae bacterium]|nr:stage III sporulation protein AD [Clostridiaceae bacterium]
MQIIQIIGIGFVATVLIIILKKQRPEIAVQASIVTGVVIFMLLASKLVAVVDVLGSYVQKAEIKPVYFATVLKITGIAYIAEFGAEICNDAGESAIASKIELAGKVIITVLAVPIITSMLDLIMEIMP